MSNKKKKENQKKTRDNNIHPDEPTTSTTSITKWTQSQQQKLVHLLLQQQDEGQSHPTSNAMGATYNWEEVGRKMGKESWECEHYYRQLKEEGHFTTLLKKRNHDQIQKSDYNDNEVSDSSESPKKRIKLSEPSPINNNNNNNNIVGLPTTPFKLELFLDKDDDEDEAVLLSSEPSSPVHPPPSPDLLLFSPPSSPGFLPKFEETEFSNSTTTPKIVVNTVTQKSSQKSIKQQPTNQTKENIINYALNSVDNNNIKTNDDDVFKTPYAVRSKDIKRTPLREIKSDIKQLKNEQIKQEEEEEEEIEEGGDLDEEEVPSEPRSPMEEGITILSSQSAPSALGSLILGSHRVAKNLDYLVSRGVKAILNCTSEIKNFYPEHFEYKKISATDSPETKLGNNFEASNQFIHENRLKGSVLVHCKMGQSRSVTMVMAYLIRHCSMSLQEACDLFEKKMIITKMNIGFQQQLMTYEKKITNKSTKDFLDSGKKRTRQKTVLYTPHSQETPTSSSRSRRASKSPMSSTPAQNIKQKLFTNNQSNENDVNGTASRTPSRTKMVSKATTTTPRKTLGDITASKQN